MREFMTRCASLSRLEPVKISMRSGALPETFIASRALRAQRAHDCDLADGCAPVLREYAARACASNRLPLLDNLQKYWLDGIRLAWSYPWGKTRSPGIT
ncbi:hypothetical protein D3C72_1730560 [compost metagenome]